MNRTRRIIQPRAARALEAFVEELSNWYIRRSRPRFWSSKNDARGGEDSTTKVAAYQTVFECLLAISKMMSPIAPFMSEWLYRSLSEPNPEKFQVSVHLSEFPEYENEAVDPVLEQEMKLARTISSVALSLRNQESINVRQPLPRVIVVTGSGVDESTVERVAHIIKEEVNVKAIEYISVASDIVKRSAKPNFKLLGKKLGPLMKSANLAIRNLNEDQINTFEKDGFLDLELEGQTVRLEGPELEIQSEGIEGWLVDQVDGVTVALDPTISEELLTEGLARESVNRIQNLRKAANFDVTDRIAIQFKGLRQVGSCHLGSIPLDKERDVGFVVARDAITHWRNC